MTPAVLPFLREAALDALAVVAPVACAGCGVPDRAVCAVCRRALSGPTTIRALMLPSVDAPGGRIPATTVAVGCGSVYETPWPAFLSAFKEEGRTDAARALARPLARAVRAGLAGVTLPDPDLEPELGRWIEVVTVPSTGAALRRRGYAPVEVLLARAGIRPLRVRPVRGARGHPLRFRRRPADQAGLGVAARAANVDGCLVARVGLEGRRILVVDDVLTTGATLRETCRAIRAAGGEVVAGAVLTAVPARRPSPRGRSLCTSDAPALHLPEVSRGQEREV